MFNTQPLHTLQMQQVMQRIKSAAEKPLTNLLIPTVLNNISHFTTQHFMDDDSIGNIIAYLFVCMYHNRNPEEKWLGKAKIEFERHVETSKVKEEFLFVKSCFEMVGYFESPVANLTSQQSIVDTFYNVKNDSVKLDLKLTNIGAVLILLFFNQFHRNGLSSTTSSYAQKGLEYFTVSTFFDITQKENLDKVMLLVLRCYLKYPNYTDYLEIMEKMVYSISTAVDRNILIDELDKNILHLLPNNNSKSFELLCKWRFNITIKNETVESKSLDSYDGITRITKKYFDNRNEIMSIVVGLKAESISVEEIGSLLLRFEPLNNEWIFRISFALLSTFELGDTQKYLIGNTMLQNLGPYLDMINSEGVLLVLSSIDTIPALLKGNDVWIELVHQYQSVIKEKFDKYEWLNGAAEYYSKMYNISKILFMSAKDSEKIEQLEKDVERYRDLCHENMPEPSYD